MKRGWLGLVLALCPGCGELGERSRFEPAVGTLEIVATYPEQGAEGVDPLSRIDFCLSAEVDPRTAESFSVLLHSGNLTFDGEQEVQLFSWRAPGSRVAVADARWCEGSVFSLTPGVALQPGLGYRVELRPALLGWAGESLDTDQGGWLLDPADPDTEELSWFLEFRIGGNAADPRPEELPELPAGAELADLFAPGEVFDPERAACGCHQREGELAHARLDLSTPEQAWESLILRSGLEPTGFPMVTPRHPSESYLIQKLLRTQAGTVLHAVQGDPMPPDGELEHEDLVKLAHWIYSL